MSSFKTLNISNPGTSTKYGGDDTDLINKLFNGVVAGIPAVRISSQNKFGFDDGIMWIYNQALSKKTTIRGQSNAPATDVDLRLPPITGNDVLPALNLSQIWLQKQQFNVGLSMQEMTAPSNPSVTFHHLYFGTDGHLYAKNSSGVAKDYDSPATLGSTVFADQTFQLKNPAGTKILTFTNPVIANDYPAKFLDRYDYLVVKDPDDGLYKARKHNWAIELQGSTAETVIQYAIDNTTAGGTVALRHAPNDWFSLTAKLNMVDKKIRLIGINDNYVTLAGSGSNAWGGTVLKKNYATADPLIDMTNTGFMVNGLENLRLVGNSTVGSTGVKLFNGRKNIFRNVSISGFDTGVEAGLWTDCDVYSLRITDSLTYGFKTNFAGAGKLNTVRFFGGSISSNPTNLYVDSSGMNDVQFFGTEFEGLGTGHVKSVQIESGANMISFYGCSFEKNGETTPLCVYDGGNNNRYTGCRFDSSVDYTPIEIRSTSKNTIFNNCIFQTNTGGTAQSVLVDSGAVNTQFLHNSKGTSTVGTVTLTDNGTSTRLQGCAAMGSSWNDKIPTTVLFNDFLEHKAISAPSSPSTGFVRAYAKTIDSNNDGMFIKRTLGGQVVEIQVA